MKKAPLLGMTLIAGVLASSVSMAVTFKGQWDISAYDDESNLKLLGTTSICIETDGTWYSIADPTGYHGVYFATGGRDLHMHGHQYVGGLPAASASGELTIVTKSLATGYWQAWDPTLTTNGYAMAKMVRTRGICQTATDGADAGQPDVLFNLQ